MSCNYKRNAVYRKFLRSLRTNGWYSGKKSPIARSDLLNIKRCLEKAIPLTGLAREAVRDHSFFNIKKYLKLSVFTVKHIIQIVCLAVAVVATYCGDIGYAIIATELLVLLFVSRQNISEILHLVKGLFAK